MTPAQEKRNNLMTAHWFVDSIYTDQKVAVSSASKELLNHIYNISNPARKHPERHLPQVEIFLLNVLMAYHCTDGVMAISKSSGNYTNKVISYRVTVELIIELAGQESRWLIEHRGFSWRYCRLRILDLEVTNSVWSLVGCFWAWICPRPKSNRPAKTCRPKRHKIKRVITTPECLQGRRCAAWRLKSTLFKYSESRGMRTLILAVSNDELGNV